MKQVSLSNVKDDLSRFLHLAEREGIVITRHGKTAGILLGFADEDDWFDYCSVTLPDEGKTPVINPKIIV